jgi:hypothetical protein
MITERRWIPDMRSPISIPENNMPEYAVSRVIYVDGSRTDNYEANGSAQAPFKTIAAAIAVLPPFDIDRMNIHVIYIMPGNYNEVVNLNAPCIFRGLDRAACRITNAVNVNACMTTLENLTIASVYFENVVYFTITNCNIPALVFDECIGICSNCIFSDLEIHGGSIDLSNNTQVSSSIDLSDSLNETTLNLFDCTIRSLTVITLGYSVVNINASHSICYAALALSNFVTLTNYNSTFLLLTNAGGSYYNYAGYPPIALEYGSLSVTITPGTAQWSINGGTTWISSGVTIPLIPVGAHTITYGPVDGYVTPAPQLVNIEANLLIEITKEYEEV